jgi:hypothetical protein
MSRSTTIATLSVLSALNLVALAVNLSQPSRAAVDGLTYQELVHNSDFARAVKSIAESCAVNVDIGRLNCQ